MDCGYLLNQVLLTKVLVMADDMSKYDDTMQQRPSGESLGWQACHPCRAIQLFQLDNSHTSLWVSSFNKSCCQTFGREPGSYHHLQGTRVIQHTATSGETGSYHHLPVTQFLPPPPGSREPGSYHIIFLILVPLWALSVRCGGHLTQAQLGSKSSSLFLIWLELKSKYSSSNF